MNAIMIYDGLRIAGLILGSCVIGVTLVVTLSYGKMYRHWNSEYRAGRVAKWRGLLPRHVTLIGFSYMGLIAWASEDMIRAFHGDLTWRLPSSFILFGIGMWAVTDMKRHVRHREDQYA